MRRTEWTSPQLVVRIQKVNILTLDFNPSPERLQKDVTTDPLCAAEVSTSKCRREYDSMMVMLPTWGFWRKRMVQDEGA